MRISKRGENNPNFGKPRSKTTRNKTSASLKNHSISKETRDKISETIHKRIPEYSHKLKQAWADPKKRESRLRIMNSPEFREKISGPNGGNWKGGISFEPYCVKFNEDFKNRVRAFFGYCCVECGTPQNGIKLHVHHVNFNKQTCCNDATPLFVPLCKSCHPKTNFDREYWEQHFTSIITNYYKGKCYFTKEEFVEMAHAT